jgi:hypothetical protein
MDPFKFCPPSIIFIVFSLTQIFLDAFKGLYNMVVMKIIVMIMLTILLNILCDMGLGIVSWILVFIPFILMTVISMLLLFAFGLNTTTGTFETTNTNVTNTSAQIQVPPVSQPVPQPNSSTGNQCQITQASDPVIPPTTCQTSPPLPPPSSPPPSSPPPSSPTQDQCQSTSFSPLPPLYPVQIPPSPVQPVPNSSTGNQCPYQYPEPQPIPPQVSQPNLPSNMQSINPYVDLFHSSSPAFQ